MVLNKRVGFLLIVLVFCSEIIAAPKLKYWVFFKDKNGTPFSIQNPRAFVSEATVSRHAMYGISFNETDLPVTPSYITSLESIANSRVLYASKWMNGVVMEIDSAQFNNVTAQVMTLPFVKGLRHVQRYRRSEPLPLPQLQPNGTRAKVAASSSESHIDYGGSRTQIDQLGLTCLHENGYRGQGMTIAVCDAGFAFVDSNPIYDSLWARNGILGTRDFADGDNDVYAHSTHGSMVMSCMAAYMPGVIVGTAPMANYWLFRTEEPRETISEEYNWIRAAEFADSVGADIITTSLGYTHFDDPSMNHSYQDLNGRTAPMSIAANMAARKGMIVLNAAGNERANSWHFISVPADADSTIAVGAVEGNGKDAPFSGVGPTPDGRVKPDLMARGAGTWVSSDTPIGFPGNGTSFACPVLAGAVACYWQAFRTQNNISIINELKNSASQANTPDSLNGYGIPNLCARHIPSETEFNVYSTRTNSSIRIEIVTPSFQPYELEVTDLAGHIHLTQKIEGETRLIVIDAETLSEGIYIVTLKSASGNQSKKVFK